MDLQERFPNEGEIQSIASAEQCEPARLLLRAMKQERDKYVQAVLTGIETLSEPELRCKGSKAAVLTTMLDVVGQAQEWVRHVEPSGDGT